ncbi:hypothetical protein ACQKP8_09595 [Photobacterium alginatilyticum]|uniref:AbiTii domain-containing protein n=1 Tax=Photobacterium alginatilyticum TaxID=1775171 RepID=UPI0040684E40
MANSIVHEIQRNALDNNYPITDLLRKAYAVASKLGLSEFKEWANCELNGYGEKEVPKCRKIKGSVKGFNQFRGWIPVQLPTDEWDAMVSTCDNGQSISEIEHLVLNDGVIASEFNVERLLILQELCGQQTDFKIFISRAAMENILSSVRNQILDWALQLEADGVIGDGISFSNEEKEKAQVAQQHIHIGGNFQGVLGNTENSTITQTQEMNVSPGDFNQLADVLGKHGVQFSDITDLQQAITEDGDVDASKGFGQKVSGWIGKMVGKAADGSWNMAVAAAGNILGAAINGYYGIGAS